MSAITSILNQIKDNGEDFEFYPTTKEIIETMYWDLRSGMSYEDENIYRCQAKRVSVLDIGAGNCKLLSTINEIANSQQYLEECYIDHRYNSKSWRSENERRANRVEFSKYMAIEKSQILISHMPAEALVVGTDFWENTLIDKRADVIFCNPPYREFAAWSARIIKEANASYIYLVIPQRWGSMSEIKEALKLRNALVKVIGSFDFLNSEDRKARAKVSLVRVDLMHGRKHGRRYDRWRKEELTMSKPVVDPFTLWFNDTFKISAEKEEMSLHAQRERDETHKESIQNAIVPGSDLVSSLVKLYNAELETLVSNYLKVAELDADILKELNINTSKLLEAFKVKIQGLKTLYWDEVFRNMSEITSRLTSKIRKRLLEELAANTNIDFTEGNIRAIAIWVIKNANNYFDEQMESIYDDFTKEECISLYKSNTHWQKDSWRYLKERNIKYALEYRIVLHGGYRQSYDKMLPEGHRRMIEDIMTIAKNLGFSINKDLVDYRVAPGEKLTICYSMDEKRVLKKGQKTLRGKIDEVFIQEDGELCQYLINGEWIHSSLVTVDSDVFAVIKSYNNGNLHFQFSPQFIKKFNLEVGRLKGWIKSPQEAVDEMDISLEEAMRYWKSSFTLLPSHMSNLLPSS